MAKPGPGLGKLPLSQELYGVRFARIATDIVSGFRPTPAGNTCMMVVQDYYTKYVQVYPLPNHTATTCATALFENWVLTWGAPLMLHSDQGPEFESRLWTEMCGHAAICKTHTNPYRPQSDGMVERLNKTLISCLTTMVNTHRDDWDEQARYVVHAYNASEHASTGCTPNMLVLGEEIIMPGDLVYGAQGIGGDLPCTVTFVEALRQNLRESYSLVRRNLEKHARLQKVGYDTGLKSRRFDVGDLVLRYSTPQSIEKTCYDYDGPHTVIHNVSETTCIIKSFTGKLTKSHVARLRPWLGLPADAGRLSEVPKQSDVCVPATERNTKARAKLNKRLRVLEAKAVKAAAKSVKTKLVRVGLNKLPTANPTVTRVKAGDRRGEAPMVCRSTPADAGAVPTRRSERILNRERLK